MKIKATISITIEVDGDHTASILGNDKRPELGKWYPEGEYTINETLTGRI